MTTINFDLCSIHHFFLANLYPFSYWLNHYCLDFLPSIQSQKKSNRIEIAEQSFYLLSSVNVNPFMRKKELYKEKIALSTWAKWNVTLFMTFYKNSLLLNLSSFVYHYYTQIIHISMAIWINININIEFFLFSSWNQHLWWWLNFYLFSINDKPNKFTLQLIENSKNKNNYDAFLTTNTCFLSSYITW